MKFLITILIALLSLAMPAIAEERVYTVRIKDIFIGKLNFNHELDETDYKITLSGETSGFAKALILAKFFGEAYGTGEKYRQYLPIHADMETRTPDYENKAELSFTGSHLTAYDDVAGIKSEVDFTKYENIVDPVTAFGYMARLTPRDQLCDKRVHVTDGVHVFKLIVLKPTWRADGRFECKGGVERVDGFSPAEIEATQNYEFTAVYRQDTESEFRLDWLITETKYGAVDVAFHY